MSEKQIIIIYDPIESRPWQAFMYHSALYVIVNYRPPRILYSYARRGDPQ